MAKPHRPSEPPPNPPERQSEARPRHLDTQIWECPNCGQSYFGAQPPDLCDYCRDFTTWRLIKPADKHP
ncbi:MAG TPA: hypothetical protein VHO69_04835 [Phototrophicaceae bacterium]|nr:hypothetical protein [Phototrophicaceae bacterium]